MSILVRAVASRYLTARKTYYHGTSLKDALAIQRSGFDLSKAKGHGAYLGRGVYLTDKYPFARGYADDYANGDWTGKPTDAAVLHLTIHPKKPLSADPQEWTQEFIEAFESHTGSPALSAIKDRKFGDIGWVAGRLKYDAIVGSGTSVVFDPSIIKVIRVEEIPAVE